MQTELQQYYNLLVKQPAQQTRREVDAIINETLLNRNLIANYYLIFKEMVSDNDIYDLGNVNQWPIHWTTKIKKLIFKINTTNDLILETQMAKDKIERMTYQWKYTLFINR